MVLVWTSHFSPMYIIEINKFICEASVTMPLGFYFIVMARYEQSGIKQALGAL